MLTIRRAQLRALHRAQLRTVEEEIFADVCRFWSNKVAELGEPEARLWVRSACRNARAFGIDSPRGLYRFTNLTFFFGKDFHHEPELQWARRILESPDLPGREKVDRLVTEARWQAAAHNP